VTVTVSRADALIRLQASDEGGEVRFLFLIHGDAEAEGAMTPDERRAIVEQHFAYADLLRERGAHVLGEALTGDVTTVRPGEPPLVTDGPFAETKEAIGGFYVVECASRAEALELAGRVPSSPGAVVEVLAIAAVRDADRA
jgi:hypothetical protein